jgi:hypothetical protein
MRALFVLVLLVGLAGCSREVHQHRAHDHAGMQRGASAQGVISLDVYRDGAVIHALTGVQKDDAVSLWHRRSADGGQTWSAPVRVDRPDAMPRQVRRGDDAQIAARGDEVLALWSVNGSGWGGSGPLAAAMSRDGGKSWAPASRPSDSGLSTGEGFADLLADKDGFHAVWLDGRDKSQGLRYSVTQGGASWTGNQTIAAATCECCWNTLLRRGSALEVLYRGKEPRDMAIATRQGNVWVKNGSVGNFNWRIKGCPETGGGLAVTPDGTLHALVWTGLEGSAGLYVTRSASSETWSVPRRIGGADAQHGDLASRGEALAAVWDEDGAVMAAQSADAGRSWGTPVRLSGGTARPANPRIVAAGEGFLALWTQTDDHGEQTLEMRHLP